MKFTETVKIGLSIALGTIVGLVIVGSLIRIFSGAHQPEPRAVVYTRTNNAEVQSSDGVNSGVFIQLHDNSPKDKPNTSWSLWLYKYDGAEYLCIVNSATGQVQLVKHK